MLNPWLSGGEEGIRTLVERFDTDESVVDCPLIAPKATPFTIWVLLQKIGVDFL